VRKLAALLLLGSALSLWAQDRPHRFVEIGLDTGLSFANSYLRTRDVFTENIVLDISKMSDELNKGLGFFMDARGGAFINFNLGALWGFGFFAKLDSLGQVKIPQSVVRLLSKGYQTDRTYSDKLGLGAAAFAEAGLWASAKIRRIKFTIRPAFYVPLIYISRPRMNYNFQFKDDGAIEMKGTYDIEMFSSLPLAGVEGFDDLGSVANNLDIADMLGKGGVDFVLRAEYPLRHNFVIGGSLGHIPVVPAQLTDKYSIKGDVDVKVDLGQILNDEIDIKDPTLEQSSGTDHQAVFRPFKISFDAVYRPFYLRLITIRPMAALVFNSIYDTPIYMDFGVTGELNLGDIFTLSIGSHLEDLVWKERFGFSLNLRVLELLVGITTQSQQFLRSFQGAGFGVDLGIRLGF
jgi:hypothetical protein